MINQLADDIAVDEAERLFTDALANIKESQLVALLADGDKSGMVMLYEKYAPVLYYKICLVVSETPLAEEALQNTFITIWENFSSFNQNKDRLYPWMVDIALNHASALKPAAAPILQDNDGQCQKQHAALSIIELLYFGDYNREEIARALSIPLDTVDAHMRTAVNHLRK